MTIEMAEQMRGPTGRVARHIAEAVTTELEKWAERPMGDAGASEVGKQAISDLLFDLDDYLPLSICTLLTELQLTGAITVGDFDG